MERKLQNSIICKGNGLQDRGFPLTAGWISLSPIRHTSLLGSGFMKNLNRGSFTSQKRVFHIVAVFARRTRVSQNTFLALFDGNGHQGVTALSFWCFLMIYFLVDVNFSLIRIFVGWLLETALNQSQNS